MKLQTQLSLVTCVGLLALAGCTNLPGATTNPTPTPTPTPSASTIPSASSLQGRLTFALNTSSNPGQVLPVGLKFQAAGSSANFAKIDASSSTDVSGNFTFTGLTDGKYQILFDDMGSVATSSFNTTGVAVSEPTTVSSTQTSIPQVNMELAWNFMTGAVPAPSGNIAKSASANFSFNAKAGVTDAYYQVTVFQTSNTASGALVSSATSSATTHAIDLSGRTSGTYYYVVKYVKNGGTFGGANYYGQTKPIPFTIQ